jgi:hypothetical protein
VFELLERTSKYDMGFCCVLHDESACVNKKEFNKEAYLDLSKPYQQNNPQSAKQDNQATTILKEVAGAARTALGSTNLKES